MQVKAIYSETMLHKRPFTLPEEEQEHHFKSGTIIGEWLIFHPPPPTPSLKMYICFCTAVLWHVKRNIYTGTSGPVNPYFHLNIYCVV